MKVYVKIPIIIKPIFFWVRRVSNQKDRPFIIGDWLTFLSNDVCVGVQHIIKVSYEVETWSKKWKLILKRSYWHNGTNNFCTNITIWNWGGIGCLFCRNLMLKDEVVLTHDYIYDNQHHHLYYVLARAISVSTKNATTSVNETKKFFYIK